MYTVPNEKNHPVRLKGGEYPGCALRVTSKDGQLVLSPDSTNCLWDKSLMVLEINLDYLLG